MDGNVNGQRTETRWLSFDELARAKAISKRAAIRLANRQGWQHRRPHRGAARVAVPASALAPRRKRPPVSRAASPPGRDVGAESTEGRIARLAGEVQALRSQATDLRLGEASARARAEAAEAEVARLRDVLEDGLLRRLRRLFSRGDRA